MISAARKQTISEEVDLYTDQANQSTKAARLGGDSLLANAHVAINGVASVVEVSPVEDGNVSAVARDVEILPPRARRMKLVEGKGRTVNDSRQWVGVADGCPKFEFGDSRVPTLDEIDGAAPEIPLFIVNLPDRFEVTSAIGPHGGFQSYLDDFAGIDELRKRHKPRTHGLLWASFICFGIAALFLVALIGQL